MPFVDKCLRCTFMNVCVMPFSDKCLRCTFMNVYVIFFLVGRGYEKLRLEIADPLAVRRLAAMYTTNINDMPYERPWYVEYCTYQTLHVNVYIVEDIEIEKKHGESCEFPAKTAPRVGQGWHGIHEKIATCPLVKVGPSKIGGFTEIFWATGL